MIKIFGNKSIRNSVEYRKAKEQFDKIFDEKKNNIHHRVYWELKPRLSWRQGITILDLQKKLRRAINDERRKNKKKPKGLCKGTIISAISDLRKFSPYIYIVNRSKNRLLCLKCNDGVDHDVSLDKNCPHCNEPLTSHREFRYFNLNRVEDREDEKERLNAQAWSANVKRANLREYEENELPQLEQIQTLKNSNGG